MQMALVIWSLRKKQALKVFRSDLLFISCCWNFVFISCWITKLDDGRGGKPAFTQRHPAHPVQWPSSQLVDRLLLSRCHLMWFGVFRASVMVVGVAAVHY